MTFGKILAYIFKPIYFVPVTAFANFYNGTEMIKVDEARYRTRSKEERKNALRSDLEEIRRRGDGWGVELLALFRWAPFGAFWFLVRVAATAAFFFCACMALRSLFLILEFPGPASGSSVVFNWRRALYEILWIFATFHAFFGLYFAWRKPCPLGPPSPFLGNALAAAVKTTIFLPFLFVGGFLGLFLAAYPMSQSEMSGGYYNPDTGETWWKMK